MTSEFVRGVFGLCADERLEAVSKKRCGAPPVERGEFCGMAGTGTSLGSERLAIRCVPGE